MNVIVSSLCARQVLGLFIVACNLRDSMALNNFLVGMVGARKEEHLSTVKPILRFSMDFM